MKPKLEIDVKNNYKQANGPNELTSYTTYLTILQHVKSAEQFITFLKEQAAKHLKASSETIIGISSWRLLAVKIKQMHNILLTSY